MAIVKRTLSLILSFATAWSLSVPIRAEEDGGIYELYNADWDNVQEGTTLIGTSGLPSVRYWGGLLQVQNWYADNNTTFVKDPDTSRTGISVKTTVTPKDSFSAHFDIISQTVKDRITSTDEKIYFGTDIYIPEGFDGKCNLVWEAEANKTSIARYSINENNGICTPDGNVVIGTDDIYNKWHTLGALADKKSQTVSYYADGKKIYEASMEDWNGSAKKFGNFMYLQYVSGVENSYDIYFDNVCAYVLPDFEISAEVGSEVRIPDYAEFKSSIDGKAAKENITWEHNNLSNSAEYERIVHGMFGANIPVAANVEVYKLLKVQEAANIDFEDGTVGVSADNTTYGNTILISDWEKNDTNAQYAENPTGEGGICIKSALVKNFSASIIPKNDLKTVLKNNNCLYFSADVYLPETFSGRAYADWYARANHVKIGEFCFNADKGIICGGETVTDKDSIKNRWHKLGVLADKANKTITYFYNSKPVKKTVDSAGEWDGADTTFDRLFYMTKYTQEQDYDVYFDNFKVYALDDYIKNEKPGEEYVLSKKAELTHSDGTVESAVVSWDGYSPFIFGKNKVFGSILGDIPIKADVNISRINSRYTDSGGNEITGTIENGIYLEAEDADSASLGVIAVYDGARLIKAKTAAPENGLIRVGFTKEELPDNINDCTVKGFLWDSLGSLTPLDALYPFGKIQVYVDSENAHMGNGTEENPFSDLGTAVKYVNHLKYKGVGVDIKLSSGTYYIDEPISFENAENISITGGENVVVSGGKNFKVSDMEKVDTGDVFGRIPESAREYIVKIPLADIGIENVGRQEIWGAYRNDVLRLYPQATVNASASFECDGTLLLPARWPNDGFAHIESVLDEGTMLSSAQSTDELRGATFKIPAEKAELWKNAKDAWLMGLWKYDWAEQNTPVASVDAENASITTGYAFSSGVSAYGGLQGGKYYIFNLPEELDAPGEYYVDRAENVFYLYPPENAEKINVSAMTEPLVKLSACKNISIENVKFADSRDMGVYAEDSEKIEISNCTFSNISQEGINLDNCKNSTVRSCKLYNLGGCAVRLSNTYTGSLVSENNVVTDCVIHDYATRNMMYSPGIYVSGTGAKITHNEIFNAPHNAIIFVGNNNTIEYNNIHNVVNNTNDAGAIYTGKSWIQRGNVIKNNYFHVLKGSDTCGAVHAVYLDDFFCGTLIKSNIFENITGGSSSAIAGCGRDTVISDNIFIDCLHMIRVNGFSGFDKNYDSILKDWTDTQARGILSNAFQNNIALYKELYGDSVCDYKEVGADSPRENLKYNLTHKGSVMKNNVLYRTDKFFYGFTDPRFAKIDTSSHASDEEPAATLAELLWTYDVPILIKDKNGIGFTDEAAKDYRLSDDSPVYKTYPDFSAPDFVNIKK